MKTLFASTSDINIVKFLNASAARLRLLCDPDFVADLYYARRDDRHAVELEVPVDTYSIETMEMLHRQAMQPAGAPLYVVASPAGEAERLAQLREDYPELRFAGLAQDVVAALVAQAQHKVFEPPPAQPLSDEPLSTAAAPVRLAVLFATPRSGSSYVCDVLEALGIGRPKEHLRDTLIELFASRYRFDRPAAIRNFLHFSAKDGWVGTKLITHFVSDFMDSCGLAELDQALGGGVEVFPIFLDRSDRSLQAISGELAARRGVWHVTDAASRAKLGNQPAIRYNFHSVLKRYIGYGSQSAFLDSLRALFDHRLDLVYETDVLDPDRLRAKICEFLDVSADDRDFSKPESRERIANEVNESFKQQFLEDFERHFKRLPLVA